MENPCTFNTFFNICASIIGPQFCYVPNTGYFFIGHKKKDTGIEGQSWKNRSIIFDKFHLEYTPNTLIMDTVNNVLIDMTGMGVQDIVNRDIHIPVPRNEWDQWLLKIGDDYARHSSIKVICRYWKLQAMGYNTSDKHILPYLKDNIVNLWYNETYPMGLMFKFYVCRDVLGGAANIYKDSCRLPKIIPNETIEKCQNYLKIVSDDLGDLGADNIIKQIRAVTFNTGCWNLNGLKMISNIIWILGGLICVFGLI